LKIILGHRILGIISHLFSVFPPHQFSIDVISSRPMVGHDSTAVTKVSWIIPLLLRNCRKTRELQELHPSLRYFSRRTRAYYKKDEIRRDVYLVEATRETRKPAPNLLSIAHARMNSGNSAESDTICDHKFQKIVCFDAKCWYRHYVLITKTLIINFEE